MYKMWKLKQNLKRFIDPEYDIPNNAPYYRTQSHITWIESRGKYGCPGAKNRDCEFYNRGCHISTNCKKNNDSEGGEQR